MNQMFEFESRWTGGMKSRWTNYLDEPSIKLVRCSHYLRNTKTSAYNPILLLCRHLRKQMFLSNNMIANVFVFQTISNTKTKRLYTVNWAELRRWAEVSKNSDFTNVFVFFVSSFVFVFQSYRNPTFFAVFVECKQNKKYLSNWKLLPSQIEKH